MKLLMLVDVDLGWDNVVGVFDREEITPERMTELKAMCKRNSYIMIDYKSTQTVESFLHEFE